MLGINVLLLGFSLTFFADSLPYDSNDLTIDDDLSNAPLDTASIDDSLSQNVFAEAITPQTQCDSNAYMDTSDTDVVKRNTAFCPSSQTQDNQLSAELATYLNQYFMIQKKRKKKGDSTATPPAPQNEWAVTYDHPVRPFLTQDHTCDEYTGRPIHVTCGGSEYGFVPPNHVEYVLNCVKGSCKSSHPTSYFKHQNKQFFLGRTDRLPNRREFRQPVYSAEYCCETYNNDVRFFIRI